MNQHPLPSRMSLPEIMGDPCATELRAHAHALLQATAASKKLIQAHPAVAEHLADLHYSVARFTSAVLSTLAAEAGVPAEGDSISPIPGPMGDYRVDRSSGCWIWMRTVTSAGRPIIGRKANGRENVPGKIYWMLVHGPLGANEIVVRTCRSRLCVNPDHARVTDRREHGAQCMRDCSPLDWDAVREIRSVLCASPAGHKERLGGLATRFGVTEHNILDVFRNKVWCDPGYTPGFQVTCAGPACDVIFRTTSMVRKYHCEECRAAALAARWASSRSRPKRTSIPAKSSERQAREETARRAQAAAAEAEWADVVKDEPRRSVWSVASIDQPIGEAGATLQDVITAGDGAGDPAAELERAFVRELLEGLTEDAIAAMGEHELAHVRARLAAADLRPSTCQTA